MTEEAQAQAYAEADFEEPHSKFVALSQEIFPEVSGYVLDLGCGPGDISFRFAAAYPKCIVHGIDGSPAMLRYARKALAHKPALKARVEFFQGVLPAVSLPRESYNAVISNSLLHHLQNPQVLWQTVKRYSALAAAVFVMDLKRPRTREEARGLVEKYASYEPEILKRDFFNSLLAAFEPAEVEGQLKEADLHTFDVTVVADRHLLVVGRMC